VTNGRGHANCSEETHLTFPPETLHEHRELGEDEPLNMRALDWATSEGRDLDVMKGCLDMQ